MFYTVENKKFMKIDAARAYAYKVVKRTGKSLDITRITVKGPSDAGTVLQGPNRIYYTPLKGKTYILYSDGSTKY